MNNMIDKIIKFGIEKLIMSEAKQLPGRLLGEEGKQILRDYYYEIIFGERANQFFKYKSRNGKNIY